MKTSVSASFLTAVGLAAVLMATGCGERQSATLPKNAVARVGDQVITRDAFERALARRAPGPGAQRDDLAVARAVLEDLIGTEALYQKALSAGYERDPEIVESLKRMVVAKYQADQLAALEQPDVTDNEILDYYRQHADRFGTPERVRAAIIEIQVPRRATPDKRAEARARAEAVLAEAAASGSEDSTFGQLARTHSEDQASRYRGGDIGWLTVGQTNASWDPAVLAALFQLEHPGDVAPVVETPTAFYLVKLGERVPATVRPLEDVREGIAYLIAREKEHLQLLEVYARAREGLPIHVSDPLLPLVSVVTNAPPPPMMPGMATTQFPAKPEKRHGDAGRW